MLEEILAETHKYALHDLEVESQQLLAGTCLRLGRTTEASNLCGEALGRAERLGLSLLDYLLTCGDAMWTAGDRAGATAYYKRALDEAGAIFDEQCPRRAKSYFLSTKQIPDYVERLSEMLVAAGRSDEARRYRERFEAR